MKTQLLFLVAALLMAAAPVGALASSVSGTVYNDKNTNNRFDSNEKGTERATIWLYRDTGGGLKLIKKVSTDAAGNYNFQGFGKGKYVLGIQFKKNKFAVRRSFSVGGNAARVRVNVPFLNAQIIARHPGTYAGYQPTKNPGMLSKDDEVSPSSPST